MILIWFDARIYILFSRKIKRQVLLYNFLLKKHNFLTVTSIKNTFFSLSQIWKHIFLTVTSRKKTHHLKYILIQPGVHYCTDLKPKVHFIIVCIAVSQQLKCLLTHFTKHWSLIHQIKVLIFSFDIFLASHLNY